MKIVLAGGSGFIGRTLTRSLIKDGNEIVLLTRRGGQASSRTEQGLTVDLWDGAMAGPWARHLEGATGVINLAGESIGSKRWTPKRKQQILRSRIDSTHTLVEAMRATKNGPAVLVNASAVGFYGDSGDDEVREERKKGLGFLSDVVDRWEKEAMLAQTLGIRVVLMRLGVVLGPNGGALQRLVLPFRMFAGGPLGSGKQWFPWVHYKDVVDVVKFAFSDSSIAGPVNVVSPGSVRLAEFCIALGKALHRPSWLPVPAFALHLILGEMAGMLLTGQCVQPKRLQDTGYRFVFPHLDEALKNILRSA